MKNYEAAIVIIPKETIINETKEKVKEDIKSFNGNIVKEDDMGVKPLGYEIDNKDQGFFYIVNFELDPSKVRELEREFKLNDNILKYLTLVNS